MVNGVLTSFVATRERAAGLRAFMDTPFISGRAALADAAELLEQFGAFAAAEAATRAAGSRAAGNVARFCHWRQIERVIVALSSEETAGTVH
jgi:hypothetical protein